MTSERELPEGEQRKQIRTLESVRSYVKEHTAGSPTTVSEYIEAEVLPEDWEEIEHGWDEDEIANMKVMPHVDNAVDSMTGGRIFKGEVLALYVLIDALKNDDAETAEELIEFLPDILWSLMEGRE